MAFLEGCSPSKKAICGALRKTRVERGDLFQLVDRQEVNSSPVFFCGARRCIGLLLRYMLSPLLGATNPYHTWGAVVFSAWYCGLADPLSQPSSAPSGFGTSSSRASTSLTLELLILE